MNKVNISHKYDEVFYRYQREGAIQSARNVLPVINAELSPESVVDIGCGAGAWLNIHSKLGVSEIIGIDGGYVDRSVLLFDHCNFIPMDISQPFDIGRDFDLVQCLEVAEHLPLESSEVLVDNLVRHGKRILFSAAVPGQGGENHINEQGYDYWRDLFAKREYYLFDFIRPRVAANSAVEPWYRYNMLFFVHASEIEGLPSSVRACRVANDCHVPDISPLSYQVRKFILKRLPVGIKTGLAVLKSQYVVRKLRFHADGS
ncbi:methyltransferase domain-containing protein [Cupriavidus sp. UYPR2.512]|uniref:methyltransferase domain-containing protein n=1 Tax=Cupriavidus sp. UYPR2.512 TaxID=1080187 RepID=UPI0009D9A587|nr:methyltransferase domain-containing protein [Cupriavidus sp. UYPR2.512]UIF86864.1 methyltransferase domain-containing protein [Cupriavidus necator]